MSLNSVRKSLYLQNKFVPKRLGIRISIHFILKKEEREDVNKYVCRLLSDSEPLGNNGDQLLVYTCQTDRESGLSPRGDNAGLLPYQ